MRFFKVERDGYIPQIGIDCGGIEITEAEYNEILSVIHNKPTPPDGYDYRLKADLTWEAYPVEPPDPDPEVDEAEAFEILMGDAE